MYHTTRWPWNCQMKSPETSAASTIPFTYTSRAEGIPSSSCEGLGGRGESDWEEAGWDLGDGTFVKIHSGTFVKIHQTVHLKWPYRIVCIRKLYNKVAFKTNIGPDEYITKEDTWVASEYMKRCSMSLVTWDTQENDNSTSCLLRRANMNTVDNGREDMGRLGSKHWLVAV